MADKDTDVRISLGADHADADAGLKETLTKVNEAVDSMTNALRKLNEASNENKDKIHQNNQEVGNSFEQLKSKIEGAHAQIMEGFERLQGAFIAFTAVLAGGKAFKEFIEEATQFNTAVLKIAQTMGVSTAQATTMQMALNKVGADADTYTSGFVKFERQIRRNSDALKALGVDTDSLKNGTKDSMQVYNEAIKIIGEYKQGNDQLQIAMTVLGSRGIQDVQKLLRAVNQDMKELRKTQEELGLTVTKEAIAMQFAYKESMAGVHEVFLGISKAVSDVMMPRLTEMAKWFISIGPSAVAVMRDVMRTFELALNAIGEVAKAIWGVFRQAFSAIGDVIQAAFGGQSLSAMQLFRNALAVIEIAITFFKTGFLQWAEIIRGGLEILGTQWSRFAATARAALSGDFRGAIAAWNSFAGKTEAIVRQTAANLKKINNDMLDDMAKSANRALTGAEGPKGTPLEPKGGKSAPDQSVKQQKDTRLQEWRDELLQKQEAAGYFNELTKQEEAKFWEDHLAMVKGNTELDKELRRQIGRIIYEDKKAFAREEQALEVQNLQEQIAAAKGHTDKQIQLAAQLAEFQRMTWGENSKQYRAALAAELKLKQQQIQELMRLEKMLEDSKMNARLADLALEKSNFDMEVALGRVSNDQKFAMLVDYENRAYQIRYEALRKEADAVMANEQATLEQKMATLQKIEALTRDHEAKVLKIKQDAIKEAAKYELEAISATENALVTFLTDSISRTKTLKQSFLDMVKSLEQSLLQLAAKKLMEDIMGAGTQGHNILSQIFGKIFGTQASAANGTKAADAALTQLATVTQQNTTEMTALVAQATAVTSNMTLLNTTLPAVQTSFSSLMAAADQAAAALLKVGASGAGGGGGGLGSLFGGGSSGGDLGAPGGPVFGSDGGGIPSFAVGTSYVPRDMLAVVHQGEAIVPKQYNTGISRAAPNVTQSNYYAISGAVDTRTQAQLASHNARTLRRATYR